MWVTISLFNLIHYTKNSLKIEDREIAYAGDDLPDLPVVRLAGLGIAVPNAHSEVRASAQIETEAAGGSGAVREICDFILQAHDRYAKVIDRYLNNN